MKIYYYVAISPFFETVHNAQKPPITKRFNFTDKKAELFQDNIDSQSR
jgi:hypothetical protein